MGKFNKFDKGRGGFGGGQRRFGGRNDGPKPMFSATCTECGNACQVPFRPTGDRPVLCSNCFKKQGGPTPRFAPKSFGGGFRGDNLGHGGFNRPTNTSSSAVSKVELDALNIKLDKIMSMLSALTTKNEPAVLTLKENTEPKLKNLGAKKEKVTVKKAKAKKK